MKKQPTAPPVPVPNPDLTMDIHELIDEVMPNPEIWKVTPNTLFYGAAPIDYIGTPKEHLLREAVLRVKYGMFS
jgi:hypothetical protein